MSLTDLEMSALKSALGCWEWFEYISTAIVWIGCAGEFAAEFTPLPRTKEAERKLSRISLIILLVGIAGELLGTIRTSQLSGQIIANTETRAAVAAQEAGDAKVSAQEAATAASRAKASALGATEKATAVERQADRLDVRMADAASSLSVLERNIVAQGPRSKPLVKAAPELVKQLERFAGQRAGLFVCGRYGAQDMETIETWAAIANILDTDQKGARWKLVPTNLTNTDCGRPTGLGQGVSVFVSKRAPKRTQEAARALSDALSKTLPKSIYNELISFDPQYVSWLISRGYEEDVSPRGMLVKDPEAIAVLIGAHPVQ